MSVKAVLRRAVDAPRLDPTATVSMLSTLRLLLAVSAAVGRTLELFY